MDLGSVVVGDGFELVALVRGNWKILLPLTCNWSEIMSRELESYGINILQLHAEWLQANGYKREATSAKKQIRMILKKKFLKSSKPQAPSLKRIADALEEILRLVKKDMEPREKSKK